MRVACLSDLHGLLPEPAAVPECDLLVLAGDVLPDRVNAGSLLDGQRRFFFEALCPWLEGPLAARVGAVVAVAGNHDELFAAERGLAREGPWRYLLDEGTSVGGLSVWGTPWSLGDPDWCFTVAGEADLAQRLSGCPAPIDVLVSHGPMWGLLDASAITGRHRGSLALLDTAARVRPRLVVVGHTHRGRGRYEGPLPGRGGRFVEHRLVVVNAAAVDADGTSLSEAFLVEL